MKDFVVGFSFKMTLTPESQVVEHDIVEKKQVKPIIPKDARWAREHGDGNGVTWHMCVKDGKLCTSQQVPYPTYK